MTEIFRIQDSDRRRKFIETMNSGLPFLAQKPTGKDVDFFSPSTGFVLLEKEVPVSPKSSRTLRVLSVVKQSLGARMGLREFYYALRGKTDLVAPFAGATNLYEEVLATMNELEIYCDVNRDAFVTGNNPKGIMFYGHSFTFGNSERLIGMTENLARKGLDEYEIRHALNIIHLEKQAAASRLIEMGFSKLTNSLITTTGGNFTRAVYCLAERFHEQRNMLFFCDGDAYGNDMLRTLEYGSMASRHLTPDQAFPSSQFGNIYPAGLFPSVAERLDIQNDVEQKRPMSNLVTKRRVDFLKAHGLVDERDLDTWERDHTYELESLSTKFFSTKLDKEGKHPPVGLGIYLVEFMRLKGIPLKPQPPEDDQTLLDDFEQAALEDLKDEIDTAISDKAPVESLKEVVEKKFQEVMDDVAKKIYDENAEEFRSWIEEVTAEQIREKVAEQYQKDPKREIFSLADIAKEMKANLSIEIEWRAEDLKKLIEQAVKDYAKSLISRAEGFHKEQIEFQELPEPEEEIREFYDVVEDELGADPKDCEEVHNALEWRLS